MKVIFWLKMISPIHSSFIKALADKENVEVTLFVDCKLLDHRVAMGWEVPDLGSAKVIVGPDDHLIHKAFFESIETTVHVFHGINYSPLISKAFQIAVRSKVRIAVWSEPYRWLGIKGYLRYLRSIVQKLKFDKRISFFLPTGNKGVELYQRAGHSKSKIFEWGYFTESIAVDNKPLSKDFNIAFVGSLVHRKGVDLLINALALVGEENVCLNIVGQGPQQQELEALVKQKGLKHVFFHKFMKNEEACKFIGQQDLFVLPSRLDGWGAVVNEALMQGTPVICSDNCGSSVLLNSDNSSLVFKAGNILSLADRLEKRVRLGKVSLAERTRIRNWAECISGERAAEYFIEIVEHVFHGGEHPTPPWRMKQSCTQVYEEKV